MNNSYFIENRMKLADEYESSGKYLHAIQLYKSVLAADPENSDAIIKTAGVYRKISNNIAAIDLLDDFLSEFPENRDVRFYLGEFLLDIKEWEKAIETLSMIPPEEEPAVSFFSGYANFMLREFELAKINFETFISLSPKGDLLYEAFYFISKAEIEMKNFQDALNTLKKAEPALGNFWEFNYNYAFAYYNTGMYAHAVRFIERAALLNGNEASVYDLAGKIHLKLGDYIKAEKNFRIFLEIRENVSSETYIYLAEACLNNSKAKEALEFFDKVLSSDPGNKLAIDGKRNASVLMQNQNRVSDG